jgi:hypothetical protein
VILYLALDQSDQPSAKSLCRSAIAVVDFSGRIAAMSGAKKLGNKQITHQSAAHHGGPLAHRDGGAMPGERLRFRNSGILIVTPVIVPPDEIHCY